MILHLPKLVYGVFALWLYRIWRIKREAAYLWLAWGIGFLPVTHVVFVGLFVVVFMLSNSPNLLRVMYRVTDYGMPVAEMICITVALHKMYDGAVQFGDLFHPRRCLAVGTASVVTEEGVPDS